MSVTTGVKVGIDVSKTQAMDLTVLHKAAAWTVQQICFSYEDQWQIYLV